jgi:hypothetical protein
MDKKQRPMFRIESLALLLINAPVLWSIGDASGSCLHTKEGPIGIAIVFGFLASLLGLAIDAVVLPIFIIIVRRGRSEMRA